MGRSNGSPTYTRHSPYRHPPPPPSLPPRLLQAAELATPGLKEHLPNRVFSYPKPLWHPHGIPTPPASCHFHRSPPPRILHVSLGLLASSLPSASVSFRKPPPPTKKPQQQNKSPSLSPRAFQDGSQDWSAGAPWVSHGKNG